MSDVRNSKIAIGVRAEAILGSPALMLNPGRLAFAS